MINEKKAFALIKKSIESKIFKDGDKAYWVTNGYFVFKTQDTESLIALGLIDFEGNTRKNMDNLRDYIDSASKNVELKHTGVLLEASKYNAALLSSDTGYVAVDDAYLKLFFNPFAKNRTKLDNIILTSKGGVYDTVYVWENQVLVGFILPVRLEDESTRLAEKLFKGA